MRFQICFVLLLLLSMPVFAVDTEILAPITSQNALELRLIATVGRGTATALAWNPDGTVLGVTSSTGLWLLNENLDQLTETAISQPLTSLAWSPDGQYLALLSDLRGRCTVQVWQADLRNLVFALDSCGNQASWSPNSRHLAIFNRRSTSNELSVFDMDSHEISILPGQDGAWSPDSQILFSRLGYSSIYHESPTIFSWNAESKEQIFAFEISDYQYFPILWGIDQENIAVQCFDNNEGLLSTGICSLNARNGGLSRLLEIGTSIEGQCICRSNPTWNSQQNLLALVFDTPTPGFLSRLLIFDPEGQNSGNLGYGFEFAWKGETNRLTTILGNGEIKTYDAESASVINESYFFTAPINQIAIHPYNQEIASASFGYDQDTHLWDLNASLIEPRLSFYIEPAEMVDYTPNGLELIAGGIIYTDIVANQNIDAFNPETGVYLRDIAAFYDQGDAPTPRYWNSDYSQYVEATSPHSALLPNGLTLTLSQNLILSDIIWSPDNRLVATVERYPDDYSFIIRTWNVETASNINGYYSGMFNYQGLVWSPNNQQIAVLLEHPTGSNIYLRGLRVFSVIQDEIYDFDRSDFEFFVDVNIDEVKQQVRAAWNSDGSLLAISSPDSLQIHNLSNGTEEALISLPAYEIEDLEWSGDDRFIAGGSTDGLIYLWAVPGERSEE